MPATMSRSILMTVGSERGDEREARVAGPGVVDGKPEPGPAQRPDRLLERHDVGDGLLLRAFERHLARVQAGVPDDRGQGGGLERSSSRLAGVRLTASA